MKKTLILFISIFLVICSCSKNDDEVPNDGSNNEPDNTTLQDVTNLSAQYGFNQITLNWTNPNGEVNAIRIECDSLSEPINLAGTTENYTINELRGGQNYTFIVKTVDGDSTSIGIEISSTPDGVISSFDTDGTCRAIKVEGNYAYIADGEAGGFLIFDISELATPVLVGSVNTPGDALDVFVTDNTAFIADGAVGGIQIIDVTDKSNPSIISSINTSGQAKKVFYKDDFLYVANGLEGLQIIDVSDLSLPVLNGSFDEMGDAISVYVHNNYAYVGDANSGLYDPQREWAMYVFDITFPDNPQLVNNTTHNTGGSIPIDIVFNNNYLYTCSYGGLHVYNVNDVENNIIEIGFGSSNINNQALCINSDYAILGSYDHFEQHVGSVAKISLLEHSSPMTIVNYDYAISDRVLDLTMDNNENIFLATYTSGMQIIYIQ